MDIMKYIHFQYSKRKNREFISKAFSPLEYGNISFEKDSNISIELKSNIKHSKIEDIL